MVPATGTPCAGDFINDYEGINSREEYRGDLTLMYFPCIDPSDGTFVTMTMVPMPIRNFRIKFNWPFTMRSILFRGKQL